METHGWYAWVNRTLSGSASFHLHGLVSAPTPGYAAELRAVETQDSDPDELVFELRLRELPGSWPDVEMPIVVRHDRHPYKGHCAGVLVRVADADTVWIPVAQVR